MKRIKQISVISVVGLLGCQTASTPIDQPHPTLDLYSEYENTKVELSQNSPIYLLEEDGYQEIGEGIQETYYDIDTTSGEYLHIVGSEYYLDGQDVQASNRWFQNQTHLIPHSEILITKDAYRIYDAKRNLQLKINKIDSYSIYVQLTEDGYYGILFQEGIYYIPKEDVQTIEENSIESSEKIAEEIPVLMYHFFYQEDRGEKPNSGNDLEVHEFQEQLQYLSEKKYSTLTMLETYYFLEGIAQVPENSILITIDDGDPSVHEYAYPLLEEYAMNATLFLITGWQSPTLDWSFWEMREDGIELQSHGFLTHQGGCSGMGHGGRLLCMGHEEGVQDTIQSLEYVDGGIAYCYPFGDYNQHAIEILQDAGVKLAFTTEPGWIHPNRNLYTLPRVRVSGGKGIEAFIKSITR